MRSFVLIKQVPDQSAKAGINPDGTIDRAKAKRMLNPFDRYALEAALSTKRQYGATVTAITMGPPPAIEVLYEAIAHGVDYGVLLSDRRLAASDTLATAYALAQAVRYVSAWQGDFTLIFCGLQTTDGDTAQVGPQLAERLGIPQITYCEHFTLAGDQVIARRAIEGGSQTVRAPLPALLTIANSAPRLAYATLRGARRVQQLLRDEQARHQVIRTITLDDIGADPERCGLKGSPTIVA
ncbi:MAG: electron transfer flavoprotein subunit beta/FixA family protein, partial [Thermostichales cyanobacterium HHBFW_bins_127]